MKKTIFAFAVSIFSLSATTIFVNSDLINEFNDITTNNVLISVEAAWEPNGSDYAWISYDQTGKGGKTPANTTGPDPFLIPTATFFENFTITTPATVAFVKAWADDTARISVGKVGGPFTQIFGPNGVQDGACAKGPIGCETGEDSGEIDFASLLTSPGNYQLKFEVYQRANHAFGLMYTGVVSDNIPEPQSMALVAGGLFGLGLLARRRMKR